MTSGRVKPTGLMRLLNAFGNTNRGLIGAWREEAAFRQECALAAVLIPLGLWPADDGVERVLLAFSWAMVLLS